MNLSTTRIYRFISQDPTDWKLLPQRHQNWRVSPELRNRDIYLRYYAQTLFQERIRLDKGVDISISSISDPQMSSSASDLTFVLCFIRCAVKCRSLFVAYFSAAKILCKSCCTALPTQRSCTLYASRDL